MEGNKVQSLPRIVKIRCSNCGYTWTHNIPKGMRVPNFRCLRCGWLYAKPC